MIDYNATLRNTLNTILPTYYELNLSRDIETPCISYMLRDDGNYRLGDTHGYSNISFQVKVWGNKLEELNMYADQIDNTLRPLGFTRTSTIELYDLHSAMKQKVMVFEGMYIEFYGG